MSNVISIRRRLLLLLLVTITLTWIGVVTLVYLDAELEMEEIYDASLAQNARILLGLLKLEVDEGDDEVVRELNLVQQQQHPYELKTVVWAHYKSDIFRSSGAPDFPEDMPEGFSDFTASNGERWRVFSLLDRESSLHIRTAQSLSARAELVGSLLQNILIAFTAGLPLFAVLIWWGVGRGLSPLKKLAMDVERLEPNSLHSVESNRVPVEVAPLITALNRLLERLRHALDKERHFTSDAAHELRTPLAALKIQTQVALRSDSPRQRDRALNKILVGIDRATHLVNQLLSLARADFSGSQGNGGDIVDLHSIAQEAVADMVVAAFSRQIELSLVAEQEAYPVVGDEAMLRVLLRNLVDNALRYSPKNSTVSVLLTHGDAGVELRVVDNGPGIPDDEISSMFQRFKRGADTSIRGSGLGLSIVKRICETHHAKVHMARADKEEGGLSVSVTFDPVT